MSPRSARISELTNSPQARMPSGMLGHSHCLISLVLAQTCRTAGCPASPTRNPLPFVYRVRPGSTTAEKFIDVSTEGPGTFFLGMLADASTNTLWTCQLTPVPNTPPPPRHTALRSFDLTTGAAKIRWNLPGDSNVCNDFTIGPDKALYITDTIPGRIFRLAPGASTAELFLDHPTLRGVDGITFLDGILYVNNVIFNKLYRIPVDAAGKPGTPVDIWIDQPIKGPDGMRAANGKLLLAENGSGKISVLA